MHANRPRRRPLALLALTLLLVAGVLAGCSDDRTGPLGPVSDASTPTDPSHRTPTLDPDLANDVAQVDLADFQREVVYGDVVHYSMELRIGSGPHDRIGIHRVVRETSVGQPLRTAENVLLFHGDLKDFVGCFLPGFSSPTSDDTFGMAYHLAARGVDVWGIDAGWTLVPGTETDLSFMADWGIDRLTDELSVAVDVARAVRVRTGSGNNRMILCGFSGGGPIILELADRESQLPVGQRRIAGLIPIDQGAKSDDPTWQEIMCREYETYASAIAAGSPALENPFPIFGGLASADPDGESPLIPGFTNRQAGLALGAYPFFPELSTVFVSGEFDENGIPTGLRFTDPDLWIDFLRDAPAYFPAKAWADAYQEMCPSVPDGPWFEHLDSIEVPTLYVTAAQGFGALMAATVDRMTASSVSRLDVSITGDPQSDVAHVDLVIGDQSPLLVFDPIAAWIHEHTDHRGRRKWLDVQG